MLSPRRSGAPLLAACLLTSCLHGQAPQPRGTVLEQCRQHVQAAARDGIVTGFRIQEAATGRVLLEIDADRLLVPASNMKLLTVAAALCAFGPRHALYTDLLVHGAVATGVLEGDLRLRGEGDPTLVSEGEHAAPRALARSLKAVGVRRVAGDLLVDDRLFSDHRVGPDWPLSNPTARWVAETAALSVDRGTVLIRVDGARGNGSPGRVSMRPRRGGVRLVNRTRTVGARSPAGVRARRLDTGGLAVEGAVRAGAAESFQVAVRDPAMLFGRLLAAALEEEGITLSGKVRRATRDDPTSSGQLVARLQASVADIIPTLGKESQNHYADMLFKHLGAASGDGGTFAGGARAVRKAFRHRGLDLGPAVIRDGSGLSRSDRVSARIVAEVLQLMWTSPWKDVFRESLPHGGEPRGTLRRRLRDLGRRVSAKTGTLRKVSALSGYVDTRGGTTLVFSILTNNGRLAAMRALQDRLVRLLASIGTT